MLLFFYMHFADAFQKFKNEVFCSCLNKLCCIICYKEYMAKIMINYVSKGQAICKVSFARIFS